MAGTTSMTGVDGGIARGWRLRVPRPWVTAWSGGALLAAGAGFSAWLLAPAWLELAVPFALAAGVAAAGAGLASAVLAQRSWRRRATPAASADAAPSNPADAPAASRGELTQVFSQADIAERLERSIEQARGSGGCALLHLDLDGFQQVREARGPAVGDLLLIEAAQRLRAGLRGTDAVGRVGESAFAVVLSGIGGAEQARRSALRLAAAVREPYVIVGVTSRIDVSAGVALFPADGDDAAALLRQARGALDGARTGGRGTVALCLSPTAAEDARRMEGELQHALELEQFEMAYQPVFGARSGVPVAYEAQVAWRHPARGLVPASVFMPLCERSGMIEKLGRWTLHAACTEAATWAVPVRLSINIEGAQFRRGDLEHLVLETLHRSGLAADRLDLEVTEAVLLEHSQQVLAAMLPLRTLGVRLVVDDFCQAAALQRFRDSAVQQVKLGRDAVQSMLTDPGAMAVVRSVLGMAAEMGIEAAAEGVEEPAQRDMLAHLGCGPMQGGLLGPPQSPERTRQYLWQATRRIEGGAVLIGAG
jgi:diguanylate cyclase (GGDEF)-like protein